jgi:hypothetical protein
MAGSILFFNGICLVMARRLSWSEIYTTTWFTIAYQMLFDVILDLKYHMYGYFGEGVDGEAYFIIFGIFPQVSYIFLTAYPWRSRKLHRFLYIMFWTVITMVYQEFAVLTGMFYRTTWEVWWEIPLSPILFWIIVLHLRFFDWLKKADDPRLA